MLRVAGDAVIPEAELLELGCRLGLHARQALQQMRPDRRDDGRRVEAPAPAVVDEAELAQIHHVQRLLASHHLPDAFALSVRARSTEVA